MGRFQSLYLPKVFASLSRKKKRNKNLPKWCFSDPTPRTSKLLSTKTTTRSCCTSHLRSPTRHFWPALTPSRSLSRRSRFVDIDGNAIKKQFRYVAKSYDRK